MFRDDHRVLAAQLERHGSEVLRGALHHHTTHVVVAREEDVVELLLQQRGSGVAVSLLLRSDHLHDPTSDAAASARRGVHVLTEETRQKLGTGGRDVGWLHDRHITRSKSCGERHHAQHEGIVPRVDDQRNTVGLGNEIAAREERDDAAIVAARSGPRRQLSDHFADVRFDDSDVVDDALEFVTVQIRLHRVQNLLLVLCHHQHELFQLRNTRANIQCPINQQKEGKALVGEERLSHLLHEDRYIAQRNRGRLADIHPLLVWSDLHILQAMPQLSSQNPHMLLLRHESKWKMR